MAAHFSGQAAGLGDADKDVRPLDGLGQAALDLAGVGHFAQPVLVGLGAVAALVKGAELVHRNDVPGPGGHQHLDDGGAGRAGPVQDDVHILHLFVHHPQSVDESGGDHDGGAVLVVVKDRDVQLLFQSLLDLKALGALDVLQVDAAKGGGDGPAGRDDAGSVGGVDADGEGVHPAELLEQHRFALHHRQSRLGADVAQAQHRRAVGDDGHHVALEGVAVDVAGLGRDLAAGLGHAGGVGGGQVVPAAHVHLADDAHLAVMGLVHFQCCLVVIHRGFLLDIHVFLILAQRGRAFLPVRGRAA